MRRRDESGVALIEFALIFPILVMIVLGVAEYGLAWRDSSTVATAARAGTRTGASLAFNGQVDYSILTSVDAALADVGPARIERIVVYKASSADGRVPAACTTTAADGINGTCNVYRAGDLSRPSSQFTSATTPAGTPCNDSAVNAKRDRWWCPTSRKSPSMVGGPDFVGVWVAVRYDAITNIIPNGSVTLKDEAVMRIEPQISD